MTDTFGETYTVLGKQYRYEEWAPMTFDIKLQGGVKKTILGFQNINSTGTSQYGDMNQKNNNKVVAVIFNSQKGLSNKIF